MNVYSQDVFFTNTHFLASYHYFPNDLGMHKTNLVDYKDNGLHFNQRKFCVAIFAYKNPDDSSLLYKNHEISLIKLRQDLAKFFQEKGSCDILGSAWPTEVEITEETGFDRDVYNWWDRKIEILKNFKFNICLENTAFPYYCTEKIWHAIIGGCLPIYYGKYNAIYETFPDNSFIDISVYTSFEDLFNYLNNMTEVEFLKRYALCYNTMIKEFDRTDTDELRNKILEKVVFQLNRLVNE